MKITYYNNKLFVDFNEAKEKDQLPKLLKGEISEIEVDIKYITSLNEFISKGISRYFREIKEKE
jgi:hypothetical protein